MSPPSEETVDEDVALVASLTGLRANHNLRERERERVRERERRRRPVRPGSSCWCPHTSHQPCHSTSKFFTSNFVNKTKKLHLQLLITQSVCAAGGHTVTWFYFLVFAFLFLRAVKKRYSCIIQLAGQAISVLGCIYHTEEPRQGQSSLGSPLKLCAQKVIE